MQIVREKAFLAVVAPKEWDAVKAAEKLKVTWSDVKPPFVEQKELYNHIRAAKPVSSGGANTNIKEPEKVDAAFKGADRVIEADLRMAVPVARQHGPGLRRRGLPAERHDARVDRLAEAALRSRRRGGDRSA